MPVDIDGAGRSRSLACLPTARGTVAPTREFSSGPVLVPYKVKALNLVIEVLGGAAGFFQAGSWGGLRPFCERTSLRKSLLSEGFSESLRKQLPSEKVSSPKGFQKAFGSSSPQKSLLSEGFSESLRKQLPSEKVCSPKGFQKAFRSSSPQKRSFLRRIFRKPSDPGKRPSGTLQAPSGTFQESRTLGASGPPGRS